MKEKYKLVYKNGSIEEDLLINADYALCLWKKNKISKMPNFNSSHLFIEVDEYATNQIKHGKIK